MKKIDTQLNVSMPLDLKEEIENICNKQEISMSLFCRNAIKCKLQGLRELKKINNETIFGL